MVSEHIEEEGLNLANFEATTLFAAAAYGTLLPQALIALGVTEAAKLLDIPAGPLNLAAIGLFASAVLLNAGVNWWMLKKHGWCMDVHLNAIHAGTKKIRIKNKNIEALISTVVGTSSTVVWGFAANPVDWYGLTNLGAGIITGVPNTVAAGTFIGKSIAPTAYALYLNHRIDNGTIDPVVTTMKKFNHFIGSRVISPLKNQAKRFGEIADSPNFNYWVQAQMLNGIGGR